MTHDRLQPALLDRLCDDARTNPNEANEQRVMSKQQLRAAVLRDLSWLFNATRPEPEPSSVQTQELQKWAGMRHARESVLNFGMPAYSGITLSSLDSATIERSVAQAIRVFEPRINADSLSVDVKLERQDSRQNTLQIVIRGQLWSQPVPLELLLAADLDVETGHTRVRELK